MTPVALITDWIIKSNRKLLLYQVWLNLAGDFSWQWINGKKSNRNHCFTQWFCSINIITAYGHKPFLLPTLAQINAENIMVPPRNDFQSNFSSPIPHQSLSHVIRGNHPSNGKVDELVISSDYLGYVPWTVNGTSYLCQSILNQFHWWDLKTAEYPLRWIPYHNFNSTIIQYNENNMNLKT